MKSLEQKQKESGKLFNANMKVLKMVFQFNEIAKVEWKGEGEYFPYMITFKDEKMLFYYKNNLSQLGGNTDTQIRFMNYGHSFSRFLYLLQEDLHKVHIGEEPTHGFYFTLR